MLMSTQANRYAHALLKARAGGTLHPLLTAEAKLNIDDAYDVARSLLNIRIANGETPLGRKIAFSNRRVQARYGKTEPIRQPLWTTLYDSTVEFAMDNSAIHSLTKALQPRIEPQIVFKLARTPAAEASLQDLAESLEWMAHGFEIAVSPFRNWEFDAADVVAGFGLHRKLIVGEPRMLSRQGRRTLGDVLASASLSMSRLVAGSGGICAAGFGNDLMESPLHALHALHRQLHAQKAFQPLQAGEIIATGSWTDPLPVKRGEVWMSAFGQLNLPGLRVAFN
ncbi:MAG: 4-oxalocrotonate decarboxylase [Burkholderiaceae bacterium]|nr:4-oxalocrotonate decarboxylase [Burkholderiaceae bacterium]